MSKKNNKSELECEAHCNHDDIEEWLYENDGFMQPPFEYEIIGLQDEIIKSNKETISILKELVEILKNDRS